MISTYISAQLSEDKRDVIVWERDGNGNRLVKRYPAPYYFYHEDPNGIFLDIYNKPLSRLDFPSFGKFYSAKEEFSKNNIKIYESDINPEYKILSKHYYNKPIGKLNVTFFDIEVIKEDHLPYAPPEDPYGQVVSIAIHHQYKNKSIIYAVPPTKDWTIDKIPKDLLELSEIVLCENEIELLEYFLAEIDDTDIIAGWNSQAFDIPYLYFRMQRIMGQEYADMLSFDGAKVPRIKEIEQFGRKMQIVIPYGRVELDYMQVFKKLEQSMRPSYALGAIADEFLPDLPKLTYSGSLDKLYFDDFTYFLRYNIRDTEILSGLDKKLKYMQFSVDFSHLATGQISDVLGTIKLTEMTIVNKCHYDLNKQVPDIVESTDDGSKYAGAFVLEPQIGMHDESSGYDVVGLYPSAIKALNISPETIIGQFIDNNRAFEQFHSDENKKITVMYEDLKTETLTSKEWREKFIKNKWCVSGYGTIYNLNFQGIIPSIVDEWGIKRKEYKTEMKKIDKEIKKIMSKYEVK